MFTHIITHQRFFFDDERHKLTQVIPMHGHGRRDGDSKCPDPLIDSSLRRDPGAANSLSPFVRSCWLSLCWLQHRPAVEGGALRRTPSCTASSKRSATSERRSPSCCPAARRARPETAGPASARRPGSQGYLGQAARATCAAAAGFRRRATSAECRQRSSPWLQADPHRRSPTRQGGGRCRMRRSQSLRGGR